MADKVEYPKHEPGFGAGRVYEDDLNRNPRWALNEGGLHFERKSRVFKALSKIANRLDELDIPYVVIGSMAMFHHGYRRFTEDVDLVVRLSDLKRIYREVVGNGYRLKFPGSQGIRDDEFGVRIELMITGHYPGNDEPKPISFPDPLDAFELFDGVKVVTRSTIIELKLAAGIGSLSRLRDIADVQDFIKHAYLPREIAADLHPYVREKYIEHWHHAQSDRLYHDLARMPE